MDFFKQRLKKRHCIYDKRSYFSFCLGLPLIPEGILSREPGWNMALCSEELLKRPVSEIRKTQQKEPPNEPLRSSTLKIMSSVLKIPQFLMWCNEMLYLHNKKPSVVPVKLHLT